MEQSEEPNKTIPIPHSDDDKLTPNPNTTPIPPSKEVQLQMDDKNSSLLASVPQPPWFTPKRLLVIFCIINLINYVDRGAIASNGVNGSSGTCSGNATCADATGIQGDFSLSNFQDGVLSSAFMVGLLVSSPIFASLAKSYNPFRLIGVGLFVWTLAVVGCGFSVNFWTITVFRMFVGVGEASFISLAAPFIDDNAPVSQKTAWLGIFYMCIPTGYAVGYVYGGLVGTHFNWRWAFFGEAVLMVPFVVVAFCLKPLQMKGFVPAESNKALTSVETDVSEDSEEVSANKDDILLAKEDKSMNQCSIFMKDMKTLLVEKVFVVNVLGYVAYSFVLGAYSYWGPKAVSNIYNMKNADMIFGGITIVCGIIGTIAGGLILDSMTSTIPNAFKLISTATFFGAIFCFGAFCSKNMYIFLGLFAIGELLVFATQGPVSFISLHCVKPSLRPLSMAISTCSIHIFGDVPSSPLVGVLQDHINNWRTTTLILSGILFPAAVIWFIGIFLKSVDRYNEESEHQVRSSKTTPLIDGNGVSATATSAESPSQV
ncbi:probable sphingolipid transporter spinster homolog 2 [Euphorbia lathyris]|uniref:probable sphingolipid transporter spinster homolog 2 n=1 Tax=Euphorbia lathyris TaxID=212925 RepID=UPI0033131D3B